MCHILLHGDFPVQLIISYFSYLLCYQENNRQGHLKDSILYQNKVTACELSSKLTAAKKMTSIQVMPRILVEIIVENGSLVSCYVVHQYNSVASTFLYVLSSGYQEVIYNWLG